MIFTPLSVKYQSAAVKVQMERNTEGMMMSKVCSLLLFGRKIG
jgi:hypothetical protein